MVLALPLGALVSLASGLLLLALAGVVVLVRPRRRANLALALFAGSFGLYFLVAAFAAQDPRDPGLWASLAVAIALAASLGLGWLALLVPRQLQREERSLLLLPAGFTLAMAAVVVALHLADPGGGAELAAVRVLRVGFAFPLLLLPLRFLAARGPGADVERRQLGFVSAALMVWPLFFSGTFYLGPIPSPAAAAFRVVLVAQPLLMAALWLRAAHRGAPPHSTMARDLVVCTLALPVAAMLLATAYGPAPVAESGAFGLARTLTVGILAYGILRHQLLGLDMKVRWTVKQSTLAAAFIGVFFVVSEGAALMLSDSLGPMMGIAAAGLLVFAMAPLQRVAERVASAAIPDGKRMGDMNRGERAEIYRGAARAAWADGRLSPDERLLLMELRLRLGLSPNEADDIERGAMPGGKT